MYTLFPHFLLNIYIYFFVCALFWHISCFILPGASPYYDKEQQVLAVGLLISISLLFYVNRHFMSVYHYWLLVSMYFLSVNCIANS